MTQEPTAADLKAAAARAALPLVEGGMRVGLGTGSTAEPFLRLLGARVRDGLNVTGVATSRRTAAVCEEEGIPLATLDEVRRLDLTVDGADEIDGRLQLVKGGGGALLREKIVAAASDRMIVIADGSKLVDTLGAFPLPIEVVRFGLEATRFAVEEVCRDAGMRGELVLRAGAHGPFETDEGHLVLDAAFGRIEDAPALARKLAGVPGVVEHGLFLHMASLALVATADGVREVGR